MLYDKDIREPLFEYLDETYGKNRIIEEKQIRKCRADVMMVLDEDLVGIEIKSDADTYVRLERQVKFYNLFFDYNMVVVGTSHAAHIKEYVPEWWGIITVEETEGKTDFYCYRQMQPNPRKHQPSFLKRQLTFLWRPELAHIQELNAMPKYRDRSKKFVSEKILAKVEPQLLKRQICEALFERDYSTIAETIEEFKKEKQGAKSK